MTVVPSPFTLMSGLIAVEITIDGIPLRFIVDTGASHTILTRTAAGRLGLEAGSASPQAARGAPGTVAATPVPVRSFRWGQIELVDLTMMVVDMDNVCGLVGTDIAGVIGHDILSRFRITIDYGIEQLILVPRREGDRSNVS